MGRRVARLWLCFGLAAPAHAQEADSDGDGIPDARDRCPAEMEDKNRYADDDGCADEKVRQLRTFTRDRDKDGILDDADRCPDVPEDKNGFQDHDGCVDEKVRALQLATPAPTGVQATMPTGEAQVVAKDRSCVGEVLGFGGLVGTDLRVRCDDGTVFEASTGPYFTSPRLSAGVRGTLTCTVQGSGCALQRFVDTGGTPYVVDEGCFLTTMVAAARGEPDDGPTLTKLRAFRDGPLSGHPDVAEYRRIAPAIVQFVEARADAATIWLRIDADWLRPIVVDLDAGRYREAHAAYRALVRELAAVEAAAWP